MPRGPLPRSGGNLGSWVFLAHPWPPAHPSPSLEHPSLLVGSLSVCLTFVEDLLIIITTL